MLMADISGSEFFGTDAQFKNEIITEIVATLAFSAMQTNDKVGILLFTDQIELFVPPKKGKSHILRIIRELLEFTPSSKKTDLSQALKYLSNVIKKKAIVFVLSDFMTQGYKDTLKIVARKHDVTGIRVFDPKEQSMPNLGMVQMLDQETGEALLVDTASKGVREHYAAYHKQGVAYYQDAFAKSGAGTIACRVDESYVKKLLGYFKTR
jgi:uncharacterized protein (DUF58 family)